LDDGSWNCSQATLLPAEPPPRRQTRGPALSPQSTWGGSRPSAPLGNNAERTRSANTTSSAPRTAPPPASVWTAPAPTQRSLLGAEAFPPLPSVAKSSPQPPVGHRGPGRNRGGQRGSSPVPGPPHNSSALESQLSLLVQQVAALTEEVRSLRNENVVLRRQLDVARGVQQHQPYAILPLADPTTSPRGPPVVRPRTAGELSPGPVIDLGGDAIMNSPPLDGDPKRARRSLAVGLEEAAASCLPDLAAHPGP
jgi:hypothetical protein